MDGIWDLIESISEGFPTYSCCSCLSWAFVKFCVCPSFYFGIGVRMWVVIVLIPDHCLSIYFSNTGFSFSMTYSTDTE